MVYGYCRISTKQQNIERQERNILAAYPAAHIVKEAYTGTKIQGRDGLQKILKVVEAGDTIVFDSVSRMSRNADEGFALYMDMLSKGVDLVFLKEPYINTATYKEAAQRQIESVKTGDTDTDEMVNAMLDAVNKYMTRLAERQIRIAFDQAQKEVDDLHQRTREGIVTARINGKQIGQQPGRKLNVKKAAPAKAIIRQHSRTFGGTLSDAECMKLAGVSRNTYYAYKRQLLNE